jgi:hypothetical protein
MDSLYISKAERIDAARKTGVNDTVDRTSKNQRRIGSALAAERNVIRCSWNSGRGPIPGCRPEPVPCPSRPGFFLG